MFQDIAINTPVKQANPGSGTNRAAPPPLASPAPPAMEEAGHAWPVGENARELLAALTASPATFRPARAQLCLPGVSIGSEQTDPVRDCVARYQGESEASKRQVLGSDGVTCDPRGLQQLLAAGNLRAALSHTAALLEMYGQGRGQAGHQSSHSQTSLQIWWVRLALLVKLRQFSTAEAEAAAFGDLETADMYYQYYPDLYPGRRGSLAPWSLRLLLAELPSHAGQQVAAMNKLFRLLRTVGQMLKNLEAGRAADGSEGGEAGAQCWWARERQVLYSLVNVSIRHQDYESAVKCLELLQHVELPALLASLHAAQGRLYLQLGNLALADQAFSQAARARDDSIDSQVDGLLDSAFLSIAQAQFQTALERFTAAEALLPGGGKVAKQVNNNIAVCLLYVGRLKEGLGRLEQDITQDPTNLQGHAMLNLCTLYELESSYAQQKKLGMLGLVSQYCNDSFNVSMLKL